MRVLALGGTGAMGGHLVRLLAARGDEVSVTTRFPRESSGNLTYIQGNARDEGFVASLLAGRWDAIIDFMVYSTSGFQRRLSRLLAATDHYIFLSSGRIYANSSDPIHEDSPQLLDTSQDAHFLSTDEYSLAKARQEEMLRKCGRKNWTIIRPYITYSEQRFQLGVLEKEGWLYRALKDRTIVFSKDMASKLTTLTYGLDVACGMAALIGESRVFGQAYHITQPCPVTWENVLEVYLQVLEKHLGRRPQVLFLGLDDFSRCKQAEYQIKYDRLFNRAFDNSKVAEFVDVQQFTVVDQGLTVCLEEFLKHPEFLPIDWRSEAIKDRYSRDWTSLSEIGSWKHVLKYLIYRFV